MQDKRAESIREFNLKALKFPIIVVYRHPKDYPDKYAARVFDITRQTDAVVVKDTLQELQRDIAWNTHKSFLPADERDEPCIVGSWI